MFRSSRIAVLLLILVGFLLYTPSLSGGFLWDDEDFVYANGYVKDFRTAEFFRQNVSAGRGKQSNYFRPVQLTAYAVIHRFFGFSPAAYHFGSILFHVLASGAVYVFLRYLTKNVYLGFLTAAVFLIHPVQTEAVSYVSGLSDPLCVLFGFLSLLMYIIWLRRHAETGMVPRGAPHSMYYLFSLSCFVISLLSKETGVIFLPLLVLLSLLYAPWPRVTLLVPFALVTALYLGYHSAVINTLSMEAVWGVSPYSSSVSVRIATFLANMKTYLALLLFPKDLFMERDFTVAIQQSWLTPWIVGFLITSLGLLLFLAVRLKQGERYRQLLFLYLGFFIAFVPVSGLVLINGIFYEHFLYAPVAFFFGFWFVALDRFITKKTALVLLGLGIALAVRSVLRQVEWSDPVRLYEQTLVHAPASVRVRNNLAMTLSERGETSRAIREYEKALAIDPGVPNLYHNLGNLYLAQGDTASAESNWRKAIDVAPDFSFSYAALLSLYRERGESAKYDELARTYARIFQGSPPR